MPRKALSISINSTRGIAIWRICETIYIECFTFENNVRVVGIIQGQDAFMRCLVF